MKRSASPKNAGGEPKIPRVEEEEPQQETPQGDDEMAEGEGQVLAERPTPQVPAAPQDEAQDAAFHQAAVAYTEFAAAAEAQAKAAAEAAGHYARMTTEGRKAAEKSGELTVTSGGVPAHPERAPRNVKVLLPSSGKLDEMEAVWQTSGDITSSKSEVYWGTDPAALSDYSTGEVTRDEKRDVNHHIVTLQKLTPGTRYYFMVGDSTHGFSQVYRFKSEGSALRDHMEMPGDRPPEPQVPGPQMAPAGRGQGTSGPAFVPGLGGAPQVASVPGMPTIAVTAEERRIDPQDGRAYTKSEFMAEYSNSEEKWQLARVASPAMAGSLSQFTSPQLAQAAIVLRGFAPKAVPLGISSFVTQRLISNFPELAEQAAFVEVSRDKDEVKLKPTGGVEVAERLANLINVTKDMMSKIFPNLTAEVQGPGQPAPAQADAAVPPTPAPATAKIPVLPSNFDVFNPSVPADEGEERRFDPECPEGRVYTKDEFIRTYGGEAEWDKAPKQDHRRIDPTDGRPYNFADFRAQYGGREQWDAAVPEYKPEPVQPAETPAENGDAAEGGDAEAPADGEAPADAGEAPVEPAETPAESAPEEELVN